MNVQIYECTKIIYVQTYKCTKHINVQKYKCTLKLDIVHEAVDIETSRVKNYWRWD